MGPDGGADEVVGVFDVGDPVAHGLVNRILQGRLPRAYGYDLGSQDVHPEHIQRLPRAVDGSHVDDALQAQQGAHRRRRDAVLAGAGLGDDPCFSEALREESLANGVVDLVGARVGELFSFEPDLRAADVLRQPFREVQRRRSPNKLPSIEVDLLCKFRILPRFRVLRLELRVRGRQRLRDVPTAEFPKVVRQKIIIIRDWSFCDFCFFLGLGLGPQRRFFFFVNFVGCCTSDDGAGVGEGFGKVLEGLASLLGVQAFGLVEGPNDGAPDHNSVRP
mmetsp:Transcript_35493/g.113402  ORF Transcript_35493/g.113402 Transcript_35493/m.113402 type:complete len:276 (-) Transcript_35493:760-1587(-)